MLTVFLARRRGCSGVVLLAMTLLSAPPIAAQEPGARQEPGAAGPALRVTPDDVVSFALEYNLRLKTDRFGPPIADEEISASAGAWTPELSSRVGSIHSLSPAATTFDAAQPSIVDQQLSTEAAWAQQLPWGTTYRVAWNGARRGTNSTFVRFDPELQAGASATLVQPLLKGLRFDDARAEHKTRLEGRAIAAASLNSAVAATKLDALRAYWAWVYAIESLAVQRESLQMAQSLLDGNRARVAVGAMAAVDVIEAQAEVARRTESIAIAEKNVANGEDLVRTVAFDPADSRANGPLTPSIVEPEGSVAAGAVERAFAQRQDLAALRATIDLEDIALRRARNDTLPDASLRAGYSLRGVGGADYASVLNDLARSRYPQWSLELSVSYPIGQARSEAEAARASLRRQQAAAAVKAAEQDVARQVRAALREVDANRRRLDLTATAVSLSERRLEAEQRKFAVGLSTSFFVFQAQRDLSQAREAALRATLDYRLATAEVEAVNVIPLTR